MNKFYIFLDIDGVMYDYKYRMKVLKEKDYDRYQTYYDPKSVSALNYLVQKIKHHNFEPIIVFISDLRYDKEKLVKIFRTSVMKSEIEYDVTPVGQGDHRELEIFKYLKAKSKSKHFCIIDDNMFGYLSFFPKSKIIHTNYFFRSLDKEYVDEFFKTANFNCTEGSMDSNFF